jgi:single-stranded-DNA-specific exonuclease
VSLLTTDDPSLASRLAESLDQTNRERQDLERQAVDQAIAMVEANRDQHEPFICVASSDWHAGVIGLVSARLKERYHRPAIAIAWDREKGIGKGSGRSIEGFDLGAMVIAARQSGLLLAGGGHKMAAGLTISGALENIDALTAFHAFARQRVSAMISPAQLQPSLRLDAQIPLSAITLDLAYLLERIEPCGNGNPTPRFALTGVRLRRVEIVKEAHLRLHLTDLQGNQATQAMAFRATETPMGQALLATPPQTILDIAVQIKHSTWQGRTKVDLVIEDAMVTNLK